MKKITRFKIFTIGIFILMFQIYTAEAQFQTLEVVKGVTAVQEGNEGNAGNYWWVINDFDNGKSKRVYMKFDISDFTNPVSGVELNVSASQDKGAGQDKQDHFHISLYGVDQTAWQPDTIKWSNKPDSSTFELATTDVTAYDSREVFTFSSM